VEIVSLIGLVLLILFLLRPRRPSRTERQLRASADFVQRQLDIGVPLEEAQRKARRLYGLERDESG